MLIRDFELDFACSDTLATVLGSESPSFPSHGKEIFNLEDNPPAPDKALGMAVINDGNYPCTLYFQTSPAVDDWTTRQTVTLAARGRSPVSLVLEGADVQWRVRGICNTAGYSTTLRLTSVKMAGA